LPDQPNYRPEKAFDVLNVIPHEQGYHPWHTWNKSVNAPEPAGQVPLIMQYYISSAGIIYNFLGTHNYLYQLLTNTWTDASSGAYAVPDQGTWTMTQFDDFVFAANGFDVPQQFNLLGGAAFTNAVYPAGPPVSKFLATIRRFVVAANTVNNSREIAWSGLSEPLLWAPDPVTLADSQVLPTGGDIMGLIGGEYGVIFQQHALQRMVFGGPPGGFEFEKISTILGCNASRSIAQYGDVVFFLSTSGVKLMRGAQEISDIGEGKVDTWLFDNLDDADLWRCTSTVDVKNKLYLLAIPVDDAETLCDVILAYHWPTGEWSKIGYISYLVCQMIPQASYNLDTVDVLIGDDIDSTDLSFDSSSLITTGILENSAFNAAGEIGHFNGAPMPATIMTGDVPITQGKQTLVRALRPMFEGEVIGLTATPYVHDMLQNIPVPTATAPVNRNGLCPVRANGRYHRFRVDTAFGGQWEHALGVDDLVASVMAP